MSEQIRETVTAEEACRILHISKRKCAWMLQNGMIPCEDTGKKTRRYTIRLDDVIAVRNGMEEYPDQYIFPITFTAKDPSKPRKHHPYYLMPDEIPEDFRAWLDDEWYRMADTVTAREIGELLGYDGDSVRRWLNRGWLQAVYAHGREIIAREWLMDFMCGHGFAIVKKSYRHTGLLRRYFEGEE